MRDFVLGTAKALMVTASIALGGGGVAWAAEDAANIIKYRQNLMKTQTGHLQAIAAVVKGEVPYSAHVKAHADGIKAISEMAGEVFPEGSGEGETRALPEIWQQRDKFLGAYSAYKTEVAKLAVVAGSGDLDAIGAQLGAVGKSCGGCHKPFRKPE